ncbi:MAG: DsbE family thiol:disulfide interchange protein [Gemmatimonadota bacterium]
MKKAALYLIPLAAFVVLAVFLLRGLWLNPREVPSPLIGKPAPVFERPRLAAPDQVFASKEMLGQVWIFNVWASWCVPCRQEHPLWNELAAQKIVPIVGMNYKDSAQTATKWLADLGNPYTTIVVDQDGRLGIDFGVYGVPETFIIDKQGVIRYKNIGPVTSESLEKKILPLVRELQKS